MEKYSLNKGDKRVIKKFLKHYLEYLREEDYCYYLSLTDDFDFKTEDEIKKYHSGMIWIITMMQHQLPNFKTVGEQDEIDRKNKILNARIINQ